MPRTSKLDAVLAAAADLFAERGYHATTVRDIAERVGLLSGSLYAHIDSKEDLLLRIVRQGGQDFHLAVEPILSIPQPAMQKLILALAAHMRTVAKSRSIATVFLYEWRALSPANRDQVLQWRASYENLWTRLLDEGVRSGEFRPLELSLTRLFALTAASGLHEWYDPEGVLSVEEIAAIYANLLTEGIRARP